MACSGLREGSTFGEFVPGSASRNAGFINLWRCVSVNRFSLRITESLLYNHHLAARHRPALSTDSDEVLVAMT